MSKASLLTYLINCFQSSSRASPLEALDQNWASFGPVKALAMWWHLPGRSFSSAMKVDNVPVLGKPQMLGLTPLIILLFLFVTCSHNNKLHILMAFLHWRQISWSAHVFWKLLNGALCSQCNVSFARKPSKTNTEYTKHNVLCNLSIYFILHTLPVNPVNVHEVYIRLNWLC